MAKVSKFSGLTVHAGWFPMLTSKGPTHAFSKSKSNRGVSAKGYNQNFAKQVQAISKQRGGHGSLLETLAKPIITQAGMGAVLGGMPFPTARGSLLTGEGVLRDRRWSDVLSSPRQGTDGKATYDAASKYESAAKKFQLHGNFVWYNKPSGGPKPLAKAIMENNFSFEQADKWYARLPERTGPKTREWAEDVLELDGKTEFASAPALNKAVRAAQEAVIPDGPFEDVEKYDKGATTAQEKDVKMKGGKYGELSEQKLDEGGAEMHGMGTPSEDDVKNEKAITDLMNTKVIKNWDKIAKKVIDTEKKQMAKKKGVEIAKISNKAAGKSAIKKSAGKLIMQSGVDATIEQMNKVKHEIAAGVLNTGAADLKSNWTEVIAKGPRSEQTGLRNYAAMDLAMDKNFKFTLNSVATIDAIDAGAAFIKANIMTSKKDIEKHSLLQQISYGQNRGLNTDLARRGNDSITQATNNVNKSVNFKTQVSFSPKIAKKYVNEIIDRFGAIIEKDLKGKEAEIQKKVLDKAIKYKKYGEIFWASPYIGLEEGLSLT